MPKPLSLSSSILIAGAGTWGVSTALHLVRRGYTNVTILDPYDVPSPISAGNDLNKIMAEGVFTDDSDASYVSQKLIKAATDGWLNDDVFKPFYHQTGFIVAANTPAAIKHMEETELVGNVNDFIPLRTAKDFRETMPEGVLTGDFPEWVGYHKKNDAGWVHARKALMSAAQEAQRLGAKFVTGTPHGSVVSLIYGDGDVLGAKTQDGIEHLADRIILAAGAGSDQLFDFEDQLRPTAWTLSHIKMTEEESQLYTNLPVLFNVEKGFFMEPDSDNHELKICDEHPGYCNWDIESGKYKSVPFAKHQIPLEAEKRARSFLTETMPHLADRPFSFARICWCADTPDRQYLISKHPKYASLVLAAGASGHGYKEIPSIGGFVVDAMEGGLDEKLAYAFRWRPDTAVERDWEDTQGRFGGPNEVMDFKKVDGWTEISYER